MTEHQKQVECFMVKAKQAPPKVHTIPDEKTLILRGKLLVEEVFEYLRASGLQIRQNCSTTLLSDLHEDDLIFTFTGAENIDFKEMVDAGADIQYINDGNMSSIGVDLEPFTNEVHESNMSKFEDCSWREDGKLIKGPNYRPADIEKVLKEQRKQQQSLKDSLTN